MAAQREEISYHKSALRRLTSLAEGRDPWALPVFCAGEFVRVVTHTKVFDPPTSLDDALSAIDHLSQSPSFRLLCPGENYLSFFQDVCRQSKARGNLIFDAQIVALLREHGVDTILTEDRDFTRFSGVRVEHL